MSLLRNFTDRALTAVDFARAYAAACGAKSVQPEHLLEALLRDTEVHALLTSHGDLGALPQHGPAVNRRFHILGDIPYSAASKRIIAEGMTEARELGYARIKPEHLLLGFLRPRRGSFRPFTREDAAVRTLRLAGVELGQLRQTVARDAERQPRSELW